MTEESENLAIRFARAAEAGRPRCELLRLPDGYETSLYVHNPSEGSKATAVVYLHGIQSHPGWFVGSAAALAARGHPVFQPTRRGSGDNRLDRGPSRPKCINRRLGRSGPRPNALWGLLDGAEMGL